MASCVTFLALLYKVIFLDFCLEYKHNDGMIFSPELELNSIILIRKWLRNLAKWNVKLYRSKYKSFNTHFTRFKKTILEYSVKTPCSTMKTRHIVSKEIVYNRTNWDIYRIQNKIVLKRISRLIPTAGIVFAICLN
jgi:hypothetical protein